MSDESINTRFRATLANVLEVDPGSIGETFGPADTAVWDSLNALRIVSELEAEFGVHLLMGNILRMNDFRAIRDTVERYLQEAGDG